MGDDNKIPPGLFPPPSGPAYGNVGVEDMLSENEVKVVEAPTMGTGVHHAGPIACSTCEHYWKMDIRAPVQNTRADGSPYTMKEDYCMATGFGLVSLAERVVIKCTKHKEKQS